tara:strand:- start:284 stop:586 length:303 start_codon:yes stop_codon:yes gene_type:complete
MFRAFRRTHGWYVARVNDINQPPFTYTDASAIAHFYFKWQAKLYRWFWHDCVNVTNHTVSIISVSDFNLILDRCFEYWDNYYSSEVQEQPFFINWEKEGF